MTARRSFRRVWWSIRYFDWRNDSQLHIPWHETIIYELHVKGFTRQHPEIPADLRGTYAGLAHPAAIDI